MKTVPAHEFVQAVLSMASGENITTDRLEGYIQRRGTLYFLKYHGSNVESPLIIQQEDIVIINPSGDPSTEELVSWCQHYVQHDKSQVFELAPGEWVLTSEGDVQKLLQFDFDGCNTVTLHYNL